MKSRIHVIISTQNNTVNAIPLLMKKEFGECSAMILTSSYAKLRRWSDFLINFLNRKNVTYTELPIDQEEKNDKSLCDLLLNELSRYEEVFFNISGGKKSQILCLMSVYQSRANDNDRLIYLDSNPFKLNVYKNMERIQELTPPKTLYLEDILNLYGYTYYNDKNQAEYQKVSPENLGLDPESIRKFNKYFLEYDDFAEMVYRAFDKVELDIDDKDSRKKIIRKELSNIGPSLIECRGLIDNSLKVNYDDVALVIKKLKDFLKKEREKLPSEMQLAELYRNLAVIPGSENIYSKYWGAIRNAICDSLLQRLESYDPILYNQSQKPVIAELIACCNDIWGREDGFPDVITHSAARKLLNNGMKTGVLFENMLALLIYDALYVESDKLDHELYMNVKVYPLERNKDSNTPEVEYDLVLVTDHGTIYSIEAKTFGHSGDIVKSKSFSTGNQGGPYSEVFMVTHVQKKFQLANGSYPEFIPAKVISQVNDLKQYVKKAWFFDEVVSEVQKLVSKQSR